MRTLNLSGIKLGDSPLISVSQGAITAGPYQPPSWGVTDTAGPIYINADRSTLQCAPDSVRFSVNLTASSFDTPGPTGDEIYDARLHDLIYLWDLGDTAGDWASPVNVLAAWKDRSVAKGPCVSHVYTLPGTYNPSVTVIEPSTGKMATAVLDGASAIVVADPDVTYGAANTIYINEVGDSDFSDALPGTPAGNKLNLAALTVDTPEWSALNDKDDPPKRWLFKRGGSFKFGITMNGGQARGLFFGGYGAGARPIVNVPVDNTNYNRCIEAQTTHSSAGTADLRVSGLDFRGNFDPTVRGPYDIDVLALQAAGELPVNAVRLQGHIDAVISDCHVSGIGRPSVNAMYSSTYPAHMHLDDCVITNHGGQYPVFGSPSLNLANWYSLTGVRISQNQMAIASPDSRAPIRLNHTQHIHIRGMDIYHCDYSQPCMKIMNTPQVDGAVVNIHSCSLEAGVQTLVLGGNTTQGLKRASAHNIVVDGMVMVGNYATQSIVKTELSGVTLRNSLMIQPECNKTSTRMTSFFAVSVKGTFADNVAAAPVLVYNCTMRCDRDISDAQNNGLTPEILGVTAVNSVLTEVHEYNNVLHMPQLPSVGSPTVPFAPLTEAVLWTPRCLGYMVQFNSRPKQPLASDVPHGESISIPYFAGYQPAALTQSDFSGTLGRASVTVGSETYEEYNDQIEVVYGATEITFTNTSGETWPSGQQFTPTVDTGLSATLSTFHATPTDAVKDSKPGTGSAALGAATTAGGAKVAYLDLTDAVRPAPADKGAWVA